MDGYSVTTYGLLDNASRGTIVDANLAKKLNVKTTKQSVAVTTVLGTQDCEFESELNVNERVLPNEIDCERYQHLADITMHQVELKQVSIIIGEDVKGAHIVQEVRVSETPECELYATRTALGWTIAGSVEVNGVLKKELSVNFLDTNNRLLNRQVEKFGEIETSGLRENDLTKTVSVEDCRAEDILHRSTKLRELDITVHETLFWTDSMIVLSYIHNTTKRFQTYVANRVNEIRELSEPTQWRHCPGELNPADDCSRGLDSQQYIEQERWLRDPEFLWNHRDSWPDQQVKEIPDGELEIKKKNDLCDSP
ncbi:Hypothetical predicted protein [Paramuricea clavata]|uniref:Uncharacterized protein n=1 Tax=Paramuricea clavata TaxID=317549 RepID=A0A6S7IRC3_PARCT|nr:Hypothetical predicted protein [Paramuricea clavata]